MSLSIITRHLSGFTNNKDNQSEVWYCVFYQERGIPKTRDIYREVHSAHILHKMFL